ncbi:MAG: DMT family transporter [Rikenellaceae bacterium]
MGIKSKSLLGVIFADVVWGLSYVLSGKLLLTMNAVSIISIRTLIAAISMCLFVLITRSNMKINGMKDFYTLVLLSLFQPVIYFIFELNAIKHSSPTFVALLMCCVPILVPLEIYITEKIKPNPHLKYGIAISVIGVVAVIMGGDENSQLLKSPLGIVLAVGAVLCATGYSTVVRRLTRRYSPITITTYQNIIGVFLFIPIFFIFDYKNFLQVQFTSETICYLVIVGVVCSSLAFLFYVNSIKNLGAATTTLINYLSPIVAAIGAYFIFSERLLPLQIFGIIVTILGLIYGTTSIKSKKI